MANSDFAVIAGNGLSCSEMIVSVRYALARPQRRRADVNSQADETREGRARPAIDFGLEWTEVAAVEACGVIGENEDLSRLENAAAVPSRHCAPSAICGICERNEQATNEDAITEAADTIACNGGNRLQEVGGPGEISPASGERRDGRRQSEHDQVADARRCLGDQIQSDRDARRRIPDQKRALLARCRAQP